MFESLRSTESRARGRAVHRAIAVLLVFCHGCLILPKTETRKRLLERRTDAEATPPGPVVVDASLEGSRVTVTAVRPRVCTYTDLDVIKVTRTTTAELEVPEGGGGGGSAEAALAILIIAPVVLAVSGLITAIIVGVSDDSSHVETHTRDTRQIPCPIALKHQPVFVSLGAGQEFAGRTDDRGRATFDLPPGAAGIERISVRFGNSTRVFVRSRQEF